jgi:thiosulfate dehydrogenase [quinone] large subunit
VAGPFEGVYHSIAGAVWADWLFMLAALILGVGLRQAAAPAACCWC